MPLQEKIYIVAAEECKVVSSAIGVCNVTDFWVMYSFKSSCP